MIKKIIKKLISSFGYSIGKIPNAANIHTRNEDVDKIVDLFMEKTIKFFPKININYKHINTIYASKFVIQNSIDGDFVECGVFKGFNIALMISSIKVLGSKKDLERKIYLYDTFTGMTKPTVFDYKKNLNYNENILRHFDNQKNGYNNRCYHPIDKVKEYLNSFNYPNLKYVRGDVMETLPNDYHTKSRISLLRLDTDFYLSTMHELDNLYKHVNKNGVIICDYFNSWEGQKKACNEFFSKINYFPLYTYTPKSDFMWIKI